MNILIIGAQATGKSVLAQALKEYHEARKEEAVVYDDNPAEMTASETAAKSRLITAIERLKKTKGKPNCHTIMVMCSGSQLMINPNLVDYLYQTSKMR